MVDRRKSPARRRQKNNGRIVGLSHKLVRSALRFGGKLFRPRARQTIGAKRRNVARVFSQEYDLLPLPAVAARHEKFTNTRFCRR